MKILMLATGMGLGGAETQICDLARKMQARGHDLHIAWLTGQVEVRIPSGVQSHPLSVTRTPIGFIRALIKLKRLIKEIKPDVVHSHMVHANLNARLTRLFQRIPVLICTAHSSHEGGSLLMLAYRLTDSLADLTTNVSEHALNEMLRKKAAWPNRTAVIHNGIDTNRFAPDISTRAQIRAALGLEDQFVFMAVGRIEPEKNHALLIRAFARILPTHPQAKLIIVGNGSRQKELEMLSQSLEISNEVLFLGARDDVPALLNAADALTLSSRFEGFGIVLAEAMATGKFVITTDCGGIAQAIRGIGTVVPVDDEAALAQALSAAINLSPEALERSGESLRTIVKEHFCLDTITDTWLQVYTNPKSAGKCS